jgi:protein ImuB
VAEQNFSEPVVSAIVIAGAIHRLAANLACRLERTGEGARCFEASFFRADGQMRRIAVETGDGTRDCGIVDRLFREKIDALSDPLDPGFGFDLIRLSAAFLQPVQSQSGGFDARENEREIRELADRLAVRFGGHRVLVLQPQDTHIPEAEAVAVPAQASWESKQDFSPNPEKDDGAHRPLRLFARPEPIEPVSETSNGPPLQFRWRHVLHHVVKAHGPERIAPEWWRHDEAMPVRDYYRVQDSLGRRFWIYRAGIPGERPVELQWYVHGNFA